MFASILVRAMARSRASQESRDSGAAAAPAAVTERETGAVEAAGASKPAERARLPS
jgi:hypothetical protein